MYVHKLAEIQHNYRYAPIRCFQLDEFGAEHPEMGIRSRVFQQRREETLANIRWMAANQAKIHEWLAQTIQ